MGYLGGYLEVHGESLMWIHVPTVSYVMLTLVIAFESGALMTFTCFGLSGLGGYLDDLLLIKLNLKQASIEIY